MAPKYLKPNTDFFGAHAPVSKFGPQLIDIGSEELSEEPNVADLVKYDQVQDEIYGRELTQEEKDEEDFKLLFPGALHDADTIKKDFLGFDKDFRFGTFNAPEVKEKDSDKFLKQLTEGTASVKDQLGYDSTTILAQEIMKAKFGGGKLIANIDGTGKYGRKIGSLYGSYQDKADKIKFKNIDNEIVKQGDSNLWIDPSDSPQDKLKKSKIEDQIISDALSRANETNSEKDWLRYETLISRSKIYGKRKYLDGDLPTTKIVGNAAIGAGEGFSRAGNFLMEEQNKLLSGERLFKTIKGGIDLLSKTYRPGKGVVETEGGKEIAKFFEPVSGLLDEQVANAEARTKAYDKGEGILPEISNEKEIEHGFNIVRENLNEAFSTNMFSELESWEVASVAKALHDFSKGRTGSAVVGIANSIMQGLVNEENLMMVIPFVGPAALIGSKAKEFKESGAGEEKALLYSSAYYFLNKLGLKASIGQIKNIGRLAAGKALGNAGTELATENLQGILESDAAGKINSVNDLAKLLRDTTRETAPSALFGGGVSFVSDTKGIVKKKIGNVVKDTALGYTLDTARIMKDTKNKSKQKDKILQAHRDINKNFGSALIEPTTTEEIRVANEDGSTNYVQTINNALAKKAELLGTDNDISREFALKEILESAYQESFTPQHFEEITKAIQEISADENLGSLIDKTGITTSAINAMLDGSRELIGKDIDGGEKTLTDTTELLNAQVTKIMGSLDLSQEEVAKVTEDKDRAIELLRKYVADGRKTITDVSEEIHDIGFLNKSTGKPSRNSISSHRDRIIKGIIDGNAPASAVSAMRQFAKSRLTKLSRNKGEHNQTFIDTINGENNAMIDMLNEVALKIKGTEYEAEYTAEIKKMKQILNQANKLGQELVGATPEKRAEILAKVTPKKQARRETSKKSAKRTQPKETKKEEPKKKAERTETVSQPVISTISKTSQGGSVVNVSVDIDFKTENGFKGKDTNLLKIIGKTIIALTFKDFGPKGQIDVTHNIEKNLTQKQAGDIIKVARRMLEKPGIPWVDKRNIEDGENRELFVINDTVWIYSNKESINVGSLSDFDKDIKDVNKDQMKQIIEQYSKADIESFNLGLKLQDQTQYKQGSRSEAKATPKQEEKKETKQKQTTVKQVEETTEVVPKETRPEQVGEVLLPDFTIEDANEAFNEATEETQEVHETVEEAKVALEDIKLKGGKKFEQLLANYEADKNYIKMTRKRVKEARQKLDKALLVLERTVDAKSIQTLEKGIAGLKKNIETLEARIEFRENKIADVEPYILASKAMESSMSARIWAGLESIQKRVMRPSIKSDEKATIYDKMILPIINFKIDTTELISRMPKRIKSTFNTPEKIAKLARARAVIATQMVKTGIYEYINSSQKEDGQYYANGQWKINNGAIVKTEGKYNLFNPLSLISTIVDGSMKFDANTTEIIGYQALKAYTDTWKVIQTADEDLVKEMFGLPADVDEQTLNKAIRAVKLYKVPRAFIVNKMGKNILSTIGLKVNGNMDTKLESQLENALGLLALGALSASDRMLEITDTIDFDAGQIHLMQLNPLGKTLEQSKAEMTDLKDSIDTFAYLVPAETGLAPSSEPVKDVDTTKRNSTDEVPADGQGYMKRQQAIAWTWTPMVDKIKDLGRQQLMNLGGWKSLDGMHAEDIEAQQSVNAQIEMDVNAMLENYGITKGTEMFFKWSMTVSDRYMMDSTINPQANKIHRFLLQTKDMITTIDLDDDISAQEDVMMFRLAMAQALDLDIDKRYDGSALKDLDKVVKIELKDGKLTAVYGKSKEGKALQEIVSDSKETITDEMIQKIADTFPGAEGYHVLQAVEALISMDNIPSNNEFSHNLVIESDAITSGMALTLLQIGSEQAWNLLAKTGIYNKKLKKEFQEKLSRATLVDGSAIPKGKDGKYMVTHGIMNEAIYKDGSGKVMDDIYNHIGTIADKEVKSIVSNLENDTSKNADVKNTKVINLVKLIQINTKGDNLISRALAKPLVMIYIYGSSMGSIARKMVFTIAKSAIVSSLNKKEHRNINIAEVDTALRNAGIISDNDKFYLDSKGMERLTRTIGGSAEKVRLFAAIGTMIYGYDSKKKVSTVSEPTFKKLDENDSLDFVKEDSDKTLGNMIMTDGMYENLRQMMAPTFAKAFRNAFSQEFSDVDKYRDTIKVVEHATYQVFKFKLNRAIAKVKAEKKKNKQPEVLTKRELSNIFLELNEIGFGHGMTNAYGTNQTLEKYDTTQDPEGSYKIAKRKAADKAADLLFTIDKQETGGYREGKANVRENIDNVRAAPTISIHSIDGILNMHASEVFENLNIFDANVMGATQEIVAGTTQEYNQRAMDTSRGHSVLSNNIEKLNGMIAGMTPGEVKALIAHLVDNKSTEGQELVDYFDTLVKTDGSVTEAIETMANVKNNRKSLKQAVSVGHLYSTDTVAPVDVKTGQVPAVKIPSKRTRDFLHQLEKAYNAKQNIKDEKKKERENKTTQEAEAKAEADAKAIDEKRRKEDAQADERVAIEESQAEVKGSSVDEQQTTDRLGKTVEIDIVDDLMNSLDEALAENQYEANNPYTLRLRAVAKMFGDTMANLGITQKIETNYWETIGRNRGKAHIGGSKIDLFINPNGDSIFTESEILMHETVHMMTEIAMQERPALRAKVRTAQEAVEKALEEKYGEDAYKLFLVYAENPTSEDIQVAKDTYDYAIRGDESEFLAYSVTNEALQNAISGTKVQHKLIKELDGSQSGFSKFLNKIIETINTIYSAIALKGDTVDKIMPQLLEELVHIQARKIAQEAEPEQDTGIIAKVKKMNEKFDGLNVQMSEKLESLLKFSIGKAGNSKFINTVSEINGIRQFKNVGLVQGIWYNLTSRTDDPSVANFYKLFRQTKKIQEADKEGLKANIVKVLNDKLGKDISKQHKRALKRALIDIDAYVLIKDGMSIEDIGELLSDEKKLDEEISKIESKVRSGVNKGLGNAYVNQANNLGHYMVTGQDKYINGMKNANNIFHAYFDPNSTIEIETDADRQKIKDIDKLATLYGIKDSGSENKALAAESIKTNSDGVQATLTLLNESLDEYNRELFNKKNNITSVDYKVKGYAYKSFLEKKTSFIVDEDNIASYRWQPQYRVAKEVDHINFVDGKKRYVVIATNVDTNYTKGIIDIIGFKHSGLDIKEILKLQGRGSSEETRAEIELLKDRSVNSLYGTSPQKVEGAQLAPVLNLSGQIVNYKIEMSHQDIVEYMGASDDIVDSIASTITNTHAKTSAIGSNIRAIDWIIADADANYHSNPTDFIILEPSKGEDAISETAEQWGIIPEYTRNYIVAQTGEKMLIVRKSLMDDVIGYKDMSAANIDYIKNNYPKLSRHIAEIEKMWKGVVGEFKRIVVTLMGDVVVANMTSNMMMYTMHGGNPTRFIQKAKEGWDLLDQYEKDHNVIVQLELLEKAGDKVPKGKIKALKKKLALNPMAPLVDDGLFTPIVEDINIDVYKKETELSKRIGKLTENVPEAAKVLGRNLYVTEDTALYGKMLKFVQYGDIISRYAVHELNLKKGMSVEDSLNYIDQLFVNYSYNENKLLSYANQTAIVMFTKYFFRTPKALIAMARKNPAMVASFQAAQSATGINVTDAVDTYYNPMQALIHRMMDPTDLIEEVVDPNVSGLLFDFNSIVKFNS